MKFKSLSLALLVTSLGLNAMQDDCSAEFVKVINQHIKLDNLLQAVPSEVEVAQESLTPAQSSAEVQLPVEELIAEQIENIVAQVQQIPASVEIQVEALQEKVEGLSNAIEEKPVCPSSYEVWGKRVADFGTATTAKIAEIKQSVINNGGQLIQLGKDNPYYVAAGIVAVIVIGGATYLLYTNGYLYRAQYKVRSAIKSACEYRKTLAVTALVAAASVAGFAAYQLGYITPEMLDTAKKSVSSRLPNMPEVNFQEKLATAQTTAKNAFNSFADNASALKTSAGNKFAAAQEVTVNSAYKCKDVAANAAGSVKSMVSAQANNAKEIAGNVAHTMVDAASQKASVVKNAFNQSKDWAYSFFAK